MWIWVQGMHKKPQKEINNNCHVLNGWMFYLEELKSGGKISATQHEKRRISIFTPSPIPRKTRT
jgi:hypothetical protein